MNSLTVDTIQTIAHDKDNITEMAWSHSGDRIAFVQSDGWIWIHDFSQAENRRLVKGRSPEWLLDNQTILFERDGIIYSCAIVDENKEKKIWDGYDLGASVQLRRPRVSPNGTILVQCLNLQRSKTHSHVFAQITLQGEGYTLLPVLIARSDVVWNAEGNACLIDAWDGDNVMYIVNENQQVEAVFERTLGDFSPNSKKIAACSAASNTIFVYEKREGQWEQIQNLSIQGNMMVRNRIHWFSDEIIGFEANSEIRLINIDTHEVSKLDLGLMNLTRRGLPSISWCPTGYAFAYEVNEGDGVALYVARLIAR